MRADEFVAHTIRYKRSLVSDSEDRTYSTVMLWQSDRQPTVRRLSCERIGSPVFSTDLSIREIRQALGGLIELELLAN